jgi:hypothetical protein
MLRPEADKRKTGLVTDSNNLEKTKRERQKGNWRE